MKLNICILILLSIAIIVSGCKKNEDNPAGPTVVAAEQWEFIMDNDTVNHGQMTYQKKSNGSVVVNAAWQAVSDGNSLDGQCNDGVVTVLDTVISIEAQGTATYSGAPAGYQKSPFTLTIGGTAHNGVGSGTWTITFSTIGWPSPKSGTFTATRSSGTGVTN